MSKGRMAIGRAHVKEVVNNYLFGVANFQALTKELNFFPGDNSARFASELACLVSLLVLHKICRIY